MTGIDFSTLELSWKPNQYLVLPEDFEARTKPHAHTRDYPIDVGALTDAFRTMALSQPRVIIAREDEGSRQFDFVQRSALFKFPDTITVQFFDRGEGKSGLAVYSRSSVGIGDMGVNKKRIESWLRTLDSALRDP